MAFHQSTTYSALLDFPLGTLWAFRELGKHRRPQRSRPSRWVGCRSAPNVRRLLPGATEPRAPHSPFPRLPLPRPGNCGVPLASIATLVLTQECENSRRPGQLQHTSPRRLACLGRAGTAGHRPRNLHPPRVGLGVASGESGT